MKAKQSILMDGETGFPIGIKEDFVRQARPIGHYQLIGDCYLDGFMDG
jgi:hypothetical protein